MGSIIRLFRAEPEAQGRKECRRLEINQRGVVGDKFYDRMPDRSVLLTGTSAYELAERNGIDLEYGDLGENILCDMDIRTLRPGMRLAIGGAVLQVSRRCPICQHLAIYDPRLPALIKELRGVYLQVLRPGTIDLEEKIAVL